MCSTNLISMPCSPLWTTQRSRSNGPRHPSSRAIARIENVEVRDYDFKRPERVSKDQMLALQTLHEAFARSYGRPCPDCGRSWKSRSPPASEMTWSSSPACRTRRANLLEAEPLEGQIRPRSAR